MKFQLVFDNSGDFIPFEVYANHELFEFFVDRLNSTQRNVWTNNKAFSTEVDKKITHLHWAVSKTNEVLYSLTGKVFEKHENLLDYLDQNYLNRLHCEWSHSQDVIVNVDELKQNINPDIAKLGWQLHDLYPDDFREDLTGAILSTLGYLYPYEQVNKGLHKVEELFKDSELLTFVSGNRYDKIDNPFDTFYAQNDVSNFSFDYTFVGRQYYDKWVNYDTDLNNDDHYNYQYLEHTFNVSLSKPQTHPFSKEFLAWCEEKNVSPIGTKIPIANINDLETNLNSYCQILYRNIKNDNNLFIQLT